MQADPVATAAAERLASVARCALAREVAALGAEGAAGAKIEVTDGCEVQITRPRSTHQGEGTAATTLAGCGCAPSPDDVKAIRRVARRCVRRVMRRQAVERAAPEAMDDPVWSYSIHTLARALLRHAGIDPVMLISAAVSTTTRGALRYLADEAGIGIGDVRVEDGRVDVSSLCADGIEMIGRGRPALLVDGARIPESALARMPGMPVASVIGHPAFRRARPVRIEQVQADGDLLTVVLADCQEPLRRPPAGVDRSWLRVPFEPLPTDD